MYRPDHEYQCLMGIYNPLIANFHPSYSLDGTFSRVTSTPSDQGGCIGSTDIYTFVSGKSPLAILVSRPFRSGGNFYVEHTVNGSPVVDNYSLYSQTLETPRLVWLPESVTRVVFNVRVEDMGYELNWYSQDAPITEACDRDFINGLGLYFMYEAHPYYSKLQLTKEADSAATYGRFLRDKLTTDLTFRGADFDTLTDSGVSEYSICSVVFIERFEEYPQQDYLVTCCYFNKVDAEVNFSECYVRPSLKPLDNYSFLLDRYSTEKNIVNIGANTKQVRIPIPPVIQFYLLGSESVTNICNDSCWEQAVSNPDISVNELRKMGFMPVSHTKIPTTLVTTRALNMVLSHDPTLGYDQRIIYALNIVSGEYVFEKTQNYDDEPTDAFPYDRYRFRYRDGMVECYDYTNGSVIGSQAYGGAWPPYAGGFASSVNGFMEAGGKSWGAYTANIDANVGIYARMLAYRDGGSDTYAIGDFAPLTKWYNWLPYGVDTVMEHTLVWEDYLLFKQSNYHTAKPTEYGFYQPELYYSNEQLSNDSYINGLKPMPIAKTWWGEYSYWVDIVGSGAESWLQSYLANVVVDDCYPIQEVVARLLNSYGVPFSFSDTFLNSMLLFGNADVVNYLKCRRQFIVPSTNITRGKYTQAAQKCMMSLKGLLDELCEVCNAGWHIDINGLHIEGNEWYDYGHTYSGIAYAFYFDFESVFDEFNGTNTLYGQIASSPDTSKLWHTLTMSSDGNVTKHFSNTELVAKAPFCLSDGSVQANLCYDLLEAVTRGVSEDGAVMLGSDRQVAISIGPTTFRLIDAVDITATTITDVKIGSVGDSVQARIMNKGFSWPYLKGRHVFRLPADKTLVEFGWMQQAEYLSTLRKAYTMPHKSISIRMPIVSSLYVRPWKLVKTTLGYGIVSGMDIDLVTRIASIKIDLLEYNL